MSPVDMYLHQSSRSVLHLYSERTFLHTPYPTFIYSITVRCFSYFLPEVQKYQQDYSGNEDCKANQIFKSNQKFYFFRRKANILEFFIFFLFSSVLSKIMERSVDGFFLVLKLEALLYISSETTRVCYNPACGW